MSVKLIFASAAALAMVAGTPAFAAKSQDRQAVASTDSDAGGGGAASAKAERKTCRFIDNTESRMKRQRLCYTREEWKKFDQAD